MENQDRSTETNFDQNVQRNSNINDKVPERTCINTTSCGNDSTAVQEPTNDRTIHVSGLSSKTTEKDLQDYFTKFGAIQSVSIIMDRNTGDSKCYGFIIFDTVESANKVIEAGNHVITNTKINVEFGKGRHGKVFVGGITNEITDEDIKSYFGQFGNVVGVKIPFYKKKNRRMKYCFVIYESVEVAKKVLKNPTQTIKNIQVSIKPPIYKSNEANGILPCGRNSYGFRRNLDQPQPSDEQMHGGYNFNQQGYPTMYGGYEGGYETYDFGGYENYVNYFQNSANISHGVGYDNYGNAYQNTENVIHGAVAGRGAPNRGCFCGTTRGMSKSIYRGANKGTHRTTARGNRFQPF